MRFLFFCGDSGEPLPDIDDMIFGDAKTRPSDR